MRAEDFVRRHIRSAPAYSPILPFDVLSKQVGVPAAEIVKLDANENPYGMPDVIRRSLADIQFGHIYPDPESRRLREAIARQTGVPAENIMVGAGADELIDLLMRLLLEPGDVILNAPPTFGMYAFDAGVNAAHVVNVPRRADFSPDIDGLVSAAYATGAKLLFLASPNNPDGSQLSHCDIKRLLELPLILVLDEAYIEFAGQVESAFSLPLEFENLVVLRTFSKWAGLAGLRIGFGSFPTWMMPYLWKIKQPYNVSVFGQEAALAALAQRDELGAIGEKIIAERDRLTEALSGLGWLSPYPSQANFVLCRVIGRDASWLKQDLDRQGIFIRYFDASGLTDHLRISVGKPSDTDRLLAALENYQEKE